MKKQFCMKNRLKIPFFASLLDKQTSVTKKYANFTSGFG